MRVDLGTQRCTGVLLTRKAITFLAHRVQNTRKSSKNWLLKSRKPWWNSRATNLLASRDYLHHPHHKSQQLTDMPAITSPPSQQQMAENSFKQQLSTLPPLLPLQQQPVDTMPIASRQNNNAPIFESQTQQQQVKMMPMASLQQQNVPTFESQNQLVNPEPPQTNFGPTENSIVVLEPFPVHFYNQIFSLLDFYRQSCSILPGSRKEFSHYHFTPFDQTKYLYHSRFFQHQQFSQFSKVSSFSCNHHQRYKRERNPRLNTATKNTGPTLNTSCSCQRK